MTANFLTAHSVSIHLLLQELQTLLGLEYFALRHVALHVVLNFAGWSWREGHFGVINLPACADVLSIDVGVFGADRFVGGAWATGFDLGGAASVCLVDFIPLVVDGFIVLL